VLHPELFDGCSHQVPMNQLEELGAEATVHDVVGQRSVGSPIGAGRVLVGH
jgi:hypothetical protein